jgi:cellulose synthase/poly-beta-1,6-N-acetylglucosamine synthase-like glycosyltransferase
LSLFVYAQVLEFYHKHLWKLKQVKITAALNHFPMVTIVVPARNEAQNILSIINAIQNQEYPSHLFEIIIV